MAQTVTKEQIEERVKQALEEFGAEPSEINRDAEFEQLDVDSPRSSRTSTAFSSRAKTWRA